MARKKRRPGDKGPKHRPSKPSGPLDDMPDRRAMEGAIQKLVAGMQDGAHAETPLDRAQALMYRAFGERDERSRVQLATDALNISADCADAYVLLAEHAPSRKAALTLYQQGFAAGERGLGAEVFRRDTGHFWGIVATRPYMRARLGFAQSLWAAARHDEALTHLKDMLRLNPADNQGVRYALAGYLLYLDRDDELARLVRQYDDEESAAWLFTKALLTFRQQGDTIPARRALKAARKFNKYVPDYILGRRIPLAELPAHYSPGDKNEALNYIGVALASWKGTTGAVPWLRANVKTKEQKTATAPAKGPLGFVKKWLHDRLPQEFDEWEADLRQMPNWIEIGGERVRPWVVLVTSRSNDLVLGHQMSEERPTAALLWDALVQSMQHPVGGEPHRPTTIHVRADDLWTSLRPHAEEIGVHFVVSDELEQLDTVFQELTEHVCVKPQPGLLDMPGMTPALAAGFYEAAASFFLKAPWKKVGFDAPIRIECTKFESGPWFAILMGQSGLITGLVLYENVKKFRMLFSEGQDEEFARETVNTSVTFGEAWDCPVPDLDAAHKHGWKVARLDAYPALVHKDRGLSTRPPLTWELELIEACLRAAPDFVTRRRQGDTTPETMTVRAAAGELTLTMAWVEECDS